MQRHLEVAHVRRDGVGHVVDSHLLAAVVRRALAVVDLPRGHVAGAADLMEHPFLLLDDGGVLHRLLVRHPLGSVAEDGRAARLLDAALGVHGLAEGLQVLLVHAALGHLDVAELVVAVVEHGAVEALEVDGQADLLGREAREGDAPHAVLGHVRGDVHDLVGVVPPGGHVVVTGGDVVARAPSPGRVLVVVVHHAGRDGPDRHRLALEPLDVPVGVAEGVAAQHGPVHELRCCHFLVGHAV